MQRILLIGQDPHICRTISGTLSGLGFGIDVAGDTRTGLLLAGRRDYSHVVVDDEIDEAGGISLFRQLNGAQTGVTGILLTAAGNLNTVVLAIEAGIRRVLAKPVDCRALLAIISAAAAGPSSQARSGQSEGEIAKLSLHDIHECLSVEQLIGIIRSVDYPFAGKKRLEHFDRDTLERVVHLVCRWCRQRLAARPAAEFTAAV